MWDDACSVPKIGRVPDLAAGCGIGMRDVRCGVDRFRASTRLSWFEDLFRFGMYHLPGSKLGPIFFFGFWGWGFRDG